MTIKKSKELSILLVEDDVVDVMGVERALAKLKILNTLIRAHDGIEGLEMLRDPNKVPRPFIVLLDINMPRMNGMEMLDEIRRDPVLTGSVVFVMTTSKADEDKMAAYSKHVAGYMLKNQLETGFLEIVKLLDNYWRIVELPVNI